MYFMNVMNFAFIFKFSLLQRKEIIVGTPTFLLERGDKVVNGGGGVDVELGGCHFFITLQFNHIYCVCGKSKVSFITFQFFSFLSQSCKILIQVLIVLKHWYISDSFRYGIENVGCFI